ncbi:MAG: DUF4105 domain-containing protein, partial [Bacteroidetes bacterium]|nr:DUF4105 domain-containing protein [Bacteroidota bacterium]
MNIKLFAIILLFFLFTKINAQQKQLSSQAEISVLTIGPGTSLNDSFGHNAFRIKDTLLGIDYTYNYGVFDFDTPNFYTKFARGKLNYRIEKNQYKNFINFYISQNRTVKEQVLNLSQFEKQTLFDFLVNNYKPENQYYLYDFFFDNCATKIRDVIPIILKEDINFNEPDVFTQKTFRRLIHDQVDRNSWGGFGIDIALGSVIDKKATAIEHMFLPKYIYLFFENATINSSKPLVKQSNILFESIKKPKLDNFITSPLFVFPGLLALGVCQRKLVVRFFPVGDHLGDISDVLLDAVALFIPSEGDVLLERYRFLPEPVVDNSAPNHEAGLRWVFDYLAS